jgi:ATP-dependent DNA helicase RecG
MADMLGKSSRTIEKNLARLRKAGKVVRVGPAKGGYWKILEEPDE